MSAAGWCAGVPPQGPHVPRTGGLVEIRAPVPMLLCAVCWRRYVDANQDRKEPTDG